MKSNISQFKGVHRVISVKERVWINGKWSIEIPAGYTYSVDPEKTGKGFTGTYLLHVQKSEDCNMSEAYSSDFNLLVHEKGMLFFRSGKDYNDPELLDDLQDAVSNFLLRYNVCRSTKEFAVLQSFLEETEATDEEEAVTTCNFAVAVRGCSYVFQGVFRCHTGTIVERRRIISEWIDTIDVLNEEEKLSFGDYSGKSRMKIPTEYGATTAVIDHGVRISIPEGFHAETNPSLIGSSRRLVIVPDGYTDYENVMEAPVALSVQAAGADNLQTRPEMAEKYFEILVTATGGLFSDSKAANIYKYSDKALSISQTFVLDDGSVKTMTALFANDKLYFIHLIASYPLSGFDEAYAVWDIEHLSKAWLGRIKVDGEPEPAASYRSTKKKTEEISFTRVTPGKELYPHYAHLLEAGSSAIPGVKISVNSGGTEYDFIPFRHAAENEETEEEMRALYNRVIAADTGNYGLDSEAREMLKLFHVTASAFNPKHDRECELKEGLMERAYMMSGLRSFAWTLADYCKKNSLKPDDVDYCTVSGIADFVAEQKWLNYDGKTYCRGLCSGGDLHVFFIPDGVTDADRKQLLPSEEDIERTRKMKEKYPSYNEILNEVHSLNELRKDLQYVYPSVRALWDKLKEGRDYGKALTGNAADIVYAWCALALAAKEPFFTEDGPMTCSFNHPSDKEAGISDAEVKPNNSTEGSTNKKRPGTGIRWAHVKEKDCEIDYFGTLTEYKGKSKNLILPDSVRVIGSDAFSTNEKLEAVLVPEGVEKIESEAFSYCTNLKEIYLPSSMKTIERKVFRMCKSLKSIIIPDGCDEIGADCFTFCGSLTDIYVPSSLYRIDIDAFCTYNDETVIHTEPGSEAETYARENDMKYDYKPAPNLSAVYEAAYAKPESKTVKSKPSIPDTPVTPDTLETPETPVTADTVSKESDFQIKDGILEKYKGSAPHAEIPSGIKKIGHEAFCGNKKLETVTIPEGVTVIEWRAFENCKNLRSVSFPESLKEIENGAFNKCTSLTSAELREKVTKIESFAFSGCTAITSVSLPSGLTKLGDYAFSDCSGLTEIKIPDGVKTMGEYVFSNCTLLRSVSLPSGLKTLPSNAFYQCKSLSTVTLPGSLSKISRSAFQFCESLREIIISEGVMDLAFGQFVFLLCKNVTVQLPESLASIKPENALNESAIEKLIVYEGSFGEAYAKKIGKKHETILTEKQKEERRMEEEALLAELRRQEELRRREAEERAAAALKAQRESLQREITGLERDIGDFQAHRVNLEEEIAELRRRSVELLSEKQLQEKIVAENRGIFGEKARRRKEAQAKLAAIATETAEVSQKTDDLTSQAGEMKSRENDLQVKLETRRKTLTTLK